MGPASPAGPTGAGSVVPAPLPWAHGPAVNTAKYPPIRHSSPDGGRCEVPRIPYLPLSNRSFVPPPSAACRLVQEPPGGSPRAGLAAAGERELLGTRTRAPGANVPQCPGSGAIRRDARRACRRRLRSSGVDVPKCTRCARRYTLARASASAAGGTAAGCDQAVIRSCSGSTTISSKPIVVCDLLTLLLASLACRGWCRIVPYAPSACSAHAGIARRQLESESESGG
jgi:hypothetical protein